MHQSKFLQDPQLMAVHRPWKSWQNFISYV